MPEMTQAVADKASSIQGRLNSAITRAREDKGLSPLGKQQKMAAAYLEAEQAMRALREGWQSSAASTKVVVAKDVFGAASTVGADAISTRDADDRAARIQTPGEAVSLLARAEENGDGVLARAIAQRAYSERGTLGDFGGGWSHVIDNYVETRPEIAAKLVELNSARSNSISTNLMAGMIFSLNRPSELNGVGNLQTMASSGSS